MKVTAFTVFAVLALGAGAAVADEARTPVSAAMILSIVSSPVESRRSAYDEALARPAPPAPDNRTAEVLPDGSVRYGRTTITVKNPCPPGHHEPMPLPGRRAGR
ncbi:MAG TPA: hypothetical protein VEA38_06385 [Terriglobales bacterium]|nr:hypothetical protein [Terriglobales bacterium]